MRTSQSNSTLQEMSLTKRWLHSNRVTDDGHLLNRENSNGATRIACNCMSSDSLNTPENPSHAINTQQLRLFVGTWNVGGRAPTRETRESMEEWLMGSPQLHDEPADIYVIGFQEIVPLTARNILGKKIKDGSAAGLLASNKWEALISATLNKTPSNSIYLDKDDSIDSADLAKTPTVTNTQIFLEKANKMDDNVALYENGDEYAKSYQYGGDGGISVHDWHNGDGSTKSHDHYDGDKITNLLDHYSGNGNSDNDKNGGDDSHPTHVENDQQENTNRENVKYMEHYPFASVTPCAKQINSTPSSSTDRCGIYSTRGIASFSEIEPDLYCGASVDRCMYTGIARKHMVGLFISVWVRHNLQHHVKGVQVSSVGCGIMNRLGNKGSVSVSLSVHETSFCFICTHLRSGDKPGDVSRRNIDVTNILQRTRFYCSEKSLSNPSLNLPSTILAHDRIIWLGDLNYRLTPSPNELQDFIIRGDWKALIELDELKKQKLVGGVFEGWHEGAICFAPTYKYRINSDTYSIVDAKESSNRRTPAWCDRILWHGKGLKQLLYTRCESKLSDHRPVRSYFMVEVESFEKSSRLTTSNVTNQSIEPFLAEVKELLSNGKLHVKQLSLHVAMLSKYKSLHPLSSCEIALS